MCFKGKIDFEELMKNANCYKVDYVLSMLTAGLV